MGMRTEDGREGEVWGSEGKEAGLEVARFSFLPYAWWWLSRKEDAQFTDNE